MIKQQFHGSDIDSVANHYGIQRDSIINFAGNVNPLGTSKRALENLSKNLHLAADYPDRHYTTLKETIANYCDSTVDKIIVGNGSTELISLAIGQVRAKKALILGPTYSEYKRELDLLGCSLDEYTLSHTNDFKLDIDDLVATLANSYDFLIICNPNNPTGGSLDHSILEILISHCKHLDVFVMIDETYIEFSDNSKHITAIPMCEDWDNLLVLRGFSKFFAAPGIRLGYGVSGSPHLLNQMLTHQNPWSVSSYAEFLGSELLQDQMYIENSHLLISTERLRIKEALSSSSKFYCYPTESNFFLLKILDSNLSSYDVFHKCMQKGLFIRDCNSFFGKNGEFIRFCLMNASENDKLLDVLLNV